MRSFVVTTLALISLTALGCSPQSSEPGLESAWDWVRLHEGSEGAYTDLSIGANGEFVLETGSRGGVSPARGLLAGERLETLARLIGELPLEAFSSSADCADDFFLSVTRNGDVTTHRIGACDPTVPEEFLAVRGVLAAFADEIDDPQRLDPEAARVLVSGGWSAISRDRVVVAENRDELVALLRMHQPDGIAVLPPVDFRREVVIGVFAGSRATGGYGLGLGPVESAESGWLTISIVESTPGDECAVTLAETRPFLLLAARRPGGGLVLERSTEVQRCR